MKYYFFRDLRSDDNLKDGTQYHAAGIVEKVYNTIDNANGDKDLSVLFFEPFEGFVMNAWRTYSEVELFEVNEYTWNSLKERLDLVDQVVF